MTGAFAGGCLPSVSRTVTQAGVVPAPRPMNYDGQPLAHWVRLEGHTSSTVTATTSRGDTASGAYVSRLQSGGAIRLGHGATDFGFEFEAAWSRGADAVDAGLGAPPDSALASSYGLALRHAFALGGPVRLGVAGSAALAVIPVRLDGADTRHDVAGAFAFALVPSVRTGPVTLFGGVDLTTEIDVPRSIVVTQSQQIEAPVAGITGGAIVLSAGLSLALRGGLHLQAQVAGVTGSELANHGLQLDVSLAFDVGTEPPMTQAPMRSFDAGPAMEGAP
ncbi:MAG: hypothetical protein K8W52_23600 [Deltaproteobacteria bacterium]|nr:hypothetical protein [Deltaproteobacteria bacterium]